MKSDKLFCRCGHEHGWVKTKKGRKMLGCYPKCGCKKYNPAITLKDLRALWEASCKESMETYTAIDEVFEKKLKELEGEKW